MDQDLVCWIQVSLSPQSLAWLLGFGSNLAYCSLFQHCRYHVARPDIYNNVINLMCVVYFDKQMAAPQTV